MKTKNGLKEHCKLIIGITIILLVLTGLITGMVFIVKEGGAYHGEYQKGYIDIRNSLIEKLNPAENKEVGYREIAKLIDMEPLPKDLWVGHTKLVGFTIIDGVLLGISIIIPFCISNVMLSTY